MIPKSQGMAPEWMEDEERVHHAILTFFEWYPFERIAGIDSDSIQDCTGFSYDEVNEAVNRLTSKGVLSIENGIIHVIKDEGYHPTPVCVGQEWQTVLLKGKDLRERLEGVALSQQTTRVYVRDRIGQWSVSAVQRALSTVEKYRRLKVAIQENLMYAQALLWQIAAAAEASENVQQPRSSGSSF